MIPTVAPRRSRSIILSFKERSWNSGFVGTEGKMKNERQARINMAIAKVQNVQGHQISDQRPAKTPPKTAPPVPRLAENLLRFQHDSPGAQPPNKLNTIFFFFPCL